MAVQGAYVPRTAVFRVPWTRTVNTYQISCADLFRPVRGFCLDIPNVLG